MITTIDFNKLFKASLDMVRERDFDLLFGRIHISKWEKGDFEATITELLSKSNKALDGKGDYWRFGNFLKQKISDETALFCRLGRIKGDKIETIFDEANRGFIPKHVDDERAIAYINFVVYPKKEIIIFEDKSPIISTHQFIKAFSLIYKSHFRVISDLTIDLMKENKKVFERIAELETVSYAELHIIPPNPDLDEEYRGAIELLAELNATDGKLEFKSKNGSLKVDKTLIGQGIHAGNAGYGDYKIIGKRRDGNIDIIKSQEEVSRTTVKAHNIPEELIGKFFERIKNRIKGQGDNK